ncbi:MAG: ATP-binding domain-containing protein [Planctomycetaceae bacterium]|nr:ATP-binding domain-containing protein [Planctomycetaceae bacterium]
MAICADALCSEVLGERLKSRGARLTEDELNFIRERLYPEDRFDLSRLVTVECRHERMEMRILLDADQKSCARMISDGVTVISGVAGSGKSLILAARARFLAERNPDWNIQLLCFNNSLVSYLQQLVGPNHPAVQVSTFHSWMIKLGIRLPLAGSEAESMQESNRLLNAIGNRVGKETVDAILIDEGQDFKRSWIQFIETALRRGGGGTVFAFDKTQSIYQVSSLDKLFEQDVRVVLLDANYRNTEEIGRFAYGTVFNVTGERGLAEGNPYQPRLPQFDLKGESVKVVWGKTLDAQSEFIAREAKRLVNEGRVTYRDIAVLYPQRAGTKSIPKALRVEGIPYFVLNKDQKNRHEFDLEQDCVKLMTAHSAKGLEFQVVFLFGGEATDLPVSLADATDEDACKARVLFVAMTRATDLLYVTYTRSNLLAERARHLPSAEVRRYPDDYKNLERVISRADFLDGIFNW